MTNQRTFRLFGRVVKISLTVLIFLVCGILLWRVFSSGDPASMSALSVNEPLREAYREHGEDLLLQYQNQNPSITQAEHNRGYFSVTQYVFIPQANQVQLVFRYNNSTIQHLKEDKGLAELPSKEDDLFDVTLVVTEDLTPNNAEDNDEASAVKKERIYPTSGGCTRDTTSLYTYYRYTFDGVTVEDLTLGVFVDVYYVGDLNYEEKAYGTLCIYNSSYDWITRGLTGEEIGALTRKED